MILAFAGVFGAAMGVLFDFNILLSVIGAELIVWSVALLLDRLIGPSIVRAFLGRGGHKRAARCETG